MGNSRPSFGSPKSQTPIVLLLMITAFSVTLITGTATAGPNCDKNSDHPKCVIDDDGGNGKVFAVKVTFDDVASDHIQGDDHEDKYYISDSGVYPESGVGARLPVEFSPPGQFVMTLRLNGNRSLYFNFGATVNCNESFASSAEGGCVFDKAEDNYFSDPVPCPFPPGARYPNDSMCAGYKQVVMVFRNTVYEQSGDELDYMLGMPNKQTFPGKGGGAEFDFREESRKDDDLRLQFDAKCLGWADGEFLNITAFDHLDSDDAVLPNDEWYIGTGDTPESTGTKTACLTKKGNGNNEDLVGLFDMQFGYTICILADPDGIDPVVPDNACIGEL